MSASLQKLQTLLQKLFRADTADLDFGIYRIINYRRNQIQAFINEELPRIINDELDANTEADSAHEHIRQLENRVRELGNNLGEEILDADGNLINEAYTERPLIQDYLAAKKQHGSPQNREQREAAVSNHLYTFFSRYYENGDFIPRRRYSQTQRYAVPYNGEEVYLHWANRDQYYVKSGEYFAAYSFKSQGITVTFDLREANIEKDNVQGTKRFFVPLPAETTYSSETDHICIPIEYRPLTDAEKKHHGGQKQQDKIIDTAEFKIIEKLTKHYKALSALERQTGGETTLKKHLRAYTRRNTADFFIHKDLKQFLNRELDVYIKNEVLPLANLMLTDVKIEGGGKLTYSNNYFETAKLVHDIALQIIDFLSHIEEFQKTLWLKKKFVLSTDYCLTLDRVPEEFYPEIAQNLAQLKEWKALFSIHEIDNSCIDTDYTEPLSVNFLKENPNLVIDTCHFDPDFTDRLLAHFDNLDTQTDGILIHGENFQGLNLLTEKYRESLKTIYIDPPYNTAASAILYKNNYKDSSWISLMADRISVSRELLAADGILCASIDDVESTHLRYLLQNFLNKENELAIVAVCSNPGGRKRPTGFAPAHEYAMFFGISDASQVGRVEWTEKQLEKYSEVDKQGKFEWRPLRKSGGPNTHREASPRLFYPLFVEDDQIRIPQMRWNEVSRRWELLESTQFGEQDIWPINSSGEEMTWGYGVETLQEKLSLSELSATADVYGNIRIRFKRYLNEEGTLPTTWWNNKEYSATAHGTRFLTNMLGDALAFLFPKSIYLIEDCLRVSSLGKKDTVLDYFAGSGTTAHATINLNRQDGGRRKYILIEMGHHFHTVLKPRLKKAIYAEKWKNAKPVTRETHLSQIIKYQRIESYEDALNNIQFTAHNNPLFKEPLLGYLLGNETRESPTLLNIDQLQNPFEYQLNIANGLQLSTELVDLPETFNYLLGLSVQTRQCVYDQNNRRYLIYRGTLKQKNVTVIWRATKDWREHDWEQDCRFITQQKFTDGADKVYVNTDSIVRGAEPLDPLFKQLMFSH